MPGPKPPQVAASITTGKKIMKGARFPITVQRGQRRKSAKGTARTATEYAVIRPRRVSRVVVIVSLHGSRAVETRLASAPAACRRFPRCQVQAHVRIEATGPGEETGPGIDDTFDHRDSWTVTPEVRSNTQSNLWRGHV